MQQQTAYYTHYSDQLPSNLNALAWKTQHLMRQFLDLGMMTEARQVQYIAREIDDILWLKADRFDFVGQVAKDATLLVGEGNLSFSLSLTGFERIKPTLLTATTFAALRDLTTAGKENAAKLRTRGATVYHGVDATRLRAFFGNKGFHTIVFQFPNVASRTPIRGHNPNFVLIRRFLASAAGQLLSGGSVLISAVDSPHYRGAFNFEQAAKDTGFALPEIYPFDPDDFPGYVHTMTHEDESALDGHKRFATWVFRRK